MFNYNRGIDDTSLMLTLVNSPKEPKQKKTMLNNILYILALHIFLHFPIYFI